MRVAQTYIAKTERLVQYKLNIAVCSKWSLFCRKDTISNTPLELTRRFTFATFVYRNHSKDTAARERGGQSCVPGPAPPPRVIYPPTEVESRAPGEPPEGSLPPRLPAALPLLCVWRKRTLQRQSG